MYFNFLGYRGHVLLCNTHTQFTCLYTPKYAHVCNYVCKHVLSCACMHLYVTFA